MRGCSIFTFRGGGKFSLAPDEFSPPKQAKAESEPESKPVIVGLEQGGHPKRTRNALYWEDIMPRLFARTQVQLRLGSAIETQQLRHGLAVLL